MKLFDYLKDKQQLVDENLKLRRAKHQVEQDIDSLNKDVLEISNKYISLLEQKSDQFDLYVKYQKQCEDLSKEKKEIKKQLAESEEICNSLISKNEDLTKTINKLERKLKKIEKQNEKSTTR